MLTRLLPTKIVDKTLSKFSAKSRAFFAPLWPSCAFTRSLVLLTEENAVSVAEKKADKMISIKQIGLSYLPILRNAKNLEFDAVPVWYLIYDDKLALTQIQYQKNKDYFYCI